MPLARVRRFGQGLGAFAHAVVVPKRRLALRNVERAFPEKTAAERRAIVRQAFRIFGATCCEMIAAERFTPEDLDRFRVTGWEHVEAAQALGRGVCFTSGHLGRWEFGALWIAHKTGSLFTVVRPLDNPHVAEEVAAARARFGNQLIAKQGAARRMPAVLRKRGTWRSSSTSAARERRHPGAVLRPSGMDVAGARRGVLHTGARWS